MVKEKFGIVISNDADATVCFAAEELSRFILESQNVNVEIAYEKEEIVFDKTFYVGWTSIVEDFNLPSDEELNSYGFIIKRKGSRMVIAGRRSRATLYGVYEYAESVLGIRFVTPEETYVPKGTREIFPDIDKVEVPNFALRSYLVEDAIKNPVFAARKRLNTLLMADVVKVGGSINADFLDEGHNTLNLINPNIWKESHPEMFNIVNDKVTDICWSDGLTDDGKLDTKKEVSVIKLLIEGLKKKIRCNPRAKYFFVGQVDATEAYCKCPKCTETAKKYGSFSACIIRALNVVTDEVTKWAKTIGRDVGIGTFAYSYSEKAPVLYDKNDEPYIVDNSVLCHPNLYVRLAPMSYNTIYPMNDKRQGEFYKTIKGWQKVSKKFMIWEYTNCFTEFLWYYPAWMNAKENCKFYKQIGAEYVMYQGEHFNRINFTELIKCYVLSKVLWNPEVDVEFLMNEFIDLYYAENADVVKKVITLFDNRVKENISNNMPDCGMHMLLFNYGAEQRPEVFPKALLEEILQTIEDRLQIIADGKQKDKLDFVRLVPMKMLLFNAKTFYTEAEEIVLTEKFCELCDKFKIDWLCENAYGGIIPETGVEYGRSVTYIKKQLSEKKIKNIKTNKEEL